MLPHFTGKKKKAKRRGHKDPLQVLREFEAKYHDTGVIPEDVWDLEKPLDGKIIFYDVLENVIAESDLPAGNRKIYRLMRHNAHCDDMDTAPKFPEEHARTELVLMNLPPLMKGEDALEKNLRYLKEEGIFPSNGRRVWAVGREIVSSDGVIYRTAIDNNELRGAALKESVDFEDIKMRVGGVLSFRFGCWVKANGLRPVRRSLAKDMEAAQVESKVWISPEPYVAGECYELDMRAAYLGCEDPELGRTGSASIPYMKKYLMPRADNGMDWCQVESLDQVVDIAGSFVRFEMWQFVGPDYLSLFEQHLREKGIMPTPLAIALRDLGFLVDHKLCGVAIPIEAAPLLKFLDARDELLGEENKFLSHRFVGSCIKRSRNSLVLCDEQEAIYFHNLLLRKGMGPRMKSVDGVWSIGYHEDAPRQYPHVRAYVLAYMHIALLTKLKECPTAVRIATDSITLRRENGRMPWIEEPEVLPYGFWRSKATPQKWARGFSSSLSTERGYSQPTHPYPRYPGELFGPSLVYVDGQGGAGKTTRAIREMEGRRVVVLSKDWMGVLDTREKIAEASEAGFDMARVTAQTYHSFWHMGFYLEKCSTKCGECLACAGWTRAKMPKDSHKRRNLPEVIIWDEIGFVPGVHLRPILEFCREKGVRVIATADILGQIRRYGDIGDEEPEAHRLLLEMEAHVVFQEGDRRSICEGLKTLKSRIWRRPEKVQIAETRCELGKLGRVGSLGTALAGWHPQSYFLVCTNSSGREIQGMLLATHARHFPEHPIPMRFKPSREQRKKYGPNSMVTMPGFLFGETREVPAIVGTRVWIECDAAMHYLSTEKDPLWVYDGWRTNHSIQGITLGCPPDLPEHRRGEYSIYILAAGLGSRWNVNSTYTAVSRAQYLEQLYWVE
jgi:hypothetical protein